MAADADRTDELIAAARAAQARSWSPYSKFPVGAAILTDTGRIIAGCNVENASFGLTVCAERTAIGTMVAEGAGRPVRIVVTGNTEEPLTPCGACRQVLSEFAPDAPVLCVGKTGKRLETTVRDLLPASFNSDALDSQ